MYNIRAWQTPKLYCEKIDIIIGFRSLTPIMPVEIASESAQYTVPNLPEAGPNVFFGTLTLVLHTRNMRGPRLVRDWLFFIEDILGSKNMTGSYFLLKGPEPSTPPLYPYDESGVVIKGRSPNSGWRKWSAHWLMWWIGNLTIKDETGHTVSLKPGDVFFIHTGSTITFSTSDFALAYKTSSRPHSKL